MCRPLSPQNQIATPVLAPDPSCWPPGGDLANLFSHSAPDVGLDALLIPVADGVRCKHFGDVFARARDLTGEIGPPGLGAPHPEPADRVDRVSRRLIASAWGRSLIHRYAQILATEKGSDEGIHNGSKS